MEFSYNKQNGSLKICMPPELDECSVKDMRSDADLLIDTYQVRHLIFDFSNTVFMDSSGVGLVMGRYRLCAGKGIKVIITNLSERNYKIMKMSGIEKIAEIKRDL